MKRSSTDQTEDDLPPAKPLTGPTEGAPSWSDFMKSIGEEETNESENLDVPSRPKKLVVNNVVMTTEQKERIRKANEAKEKRHQELKMKRQQARLQAEANEKTTQPEVTPAPNPAALTQNTIEPPIGGLSDKTESEGIRNLHSKIELTKPPEEKPKTEQKPVVNQEVVRVDKGIIQEKVVQQANVQGTLQVPTSLPPGIEQKYKSIEESNPKVDSELKTPSMISNFFSHAEQIFQSTYSIEKENIELKMKVASLELKMKTMNVELTRLKNTNQIITKQNAELLEYSERLLQQDSLKPS